MADSRILKAIRLIRTIRYLKPVQILGRIWFRLRRPIPEVVTNQLGAHRQGKWSPIPRNPSMSGPVSFDFLNQSRELSRPSDWNNPDWPKLWVYNLHYFDDLVADGATTRELWHRNLIERWVRENPPAKGIGWDPYPTSLRIVNWIKWALTGHKLSQVAMDSLATQAEWLSKRMEHHLLGNHLFANAKALMFAGCFFDTPRSQRWRNRAMGLLEREIREQILPDGGHFERSVMYHAILLEDLSDLLQLAEIFPNALSSTQCAEWTRVRSRMRDWLAAMTHPDGRIAFFNDGAFGISAEPNALGAGMTLAGPSVHLSTSGYARLQTGSAVVLCDAAPIGPDYLPGHAHADSLSFELSLDGQRLIVNGGTSVYDADPDRRHLERSTRSHNTVEVDGQNSSEVWASFRVARRARVTDALFEESDIAQALTARHDGFRRHGGPWHRRRWELTETSLTIMDSLTGGHWEQAQARFRIAPPYDATPERILGPRPVRLSATGGSLSVEESDWAPEFGKVVPCKVLVLDAEQREFSLNLEWGV